MVMHTTRRAEMGIGTLIIFIALLLVAAIAAGVLIQTAGSLQEKALTTGDQAKGQIATNVRVVEVSATDGRNGTVRFFSQIIKLAPGSDSIKLDQTLMTMNTFDRTATLTFAGDTATIFNEATGYYTWNVDEVTQTGGTYSALYNDYDEDGTVDTLTGGLTGAGLLLNMTTNGTVLLGNCTGGVWTTNATLTTVERVTASCSADDNVTAVDITPHNEGVGVYSVEYLQTGSNHVHGNLQRGDIIKIYYEGPKAIGEDEKIRINFIPKIGTPTLTEFITGNVITTERVYLYP